MSAPDKNGSKFVSGAKMLVVGPFDDATVGVAKHLGIWRTWAYQGSTYADAWEGVGPVVLRACGG